MVALGSGGRVLYVAGSCGGRGFKDDGLESFVAVDVFVVNATFSISSYQIKLFSKHSSGAGIGGGWKGEGNLYINTLCNTGGSVGTQTAVGVHLVDVIGGGGRLQNILTTSSNVSN